MDKYREKLQNLIEVLLLTMLLLAPLKFGTMLLPGVPQFSGCDIWNLLINSLPPAFFPVAAGGVLLLALTVFGIKEQNTCGQGSLIWVLAAAGLVPAALLGFVNADNLESPVTELEFLLGVAAFAAAVWVVLEHRGEAFRGRLFNAIICGSIFTALVGVHQYFFGFDELKAFIEMQEKVYNIKIPTALKNRAYDVRTYATFTFASALAAMFCLTGVLGVVRAYCWGRHFEPVKLSQRVFALLTAVLMGGVFLSTKGRGAFLAVIVSAALTGFILIKKRRTKLLIAAAAAAAIVAGAIYIHYAGRGFASMSERAGYLKSSLEMMIEHPFLGGGWGDFTYHHALNKSFGNEELAKDPHNIAAAFFAQCGIFGGLLVSLLLLGAIWGAGRRLKNEFSWENTALFFGLTAFSLHSLMDLDWQVPGLMMLWSAVALAALYEPGEIQFRKWQRNLLSTLWWIVALAALAGGLHWSIYDGRFAAMKSAAGMDVAGAGSRASSRYEVDALAQETLKIAPYSAAVFTAWGMDALQRNDLAAAEERLLKAAELTPRAHAVYELLSEVAKEKNDPLKMQKYQDKADQLFPYKKIFFEQHPERKP